MGGIISLERTTRKLTRAHNALTVHANEHDQLHNNTHCNDADQNHGRICKPARIPRRQEFKSQRRLQTSSGSQTTNPKKLKNPATQPEKYAANAKGPIAAATSSIVTTALVTQTLEDLAAIDEA